MATFSHLVATKMRPSLLSRHAAVSRIASLQRNGLVQICTQIFYPYFITIFHHERDIPPQKME